MSGCGHNPSCPQHREWGQGQSGTASLHPTRPWCSSYRWGYCYCPDPVQNTDGMWSSYIWKWGNHAQWKNVTRKLFLTSIYWEELDYILMQMWLITGCFKIFWSNYQIRVSIEIYFCSSVNVKSAKSGVWLCLDGSVKSTWEVSA